MTLGRESLEAAYRRTEYRVRAPEGTFTIHIGARCEVLEALLREVGARSWAFVTACNPRSQPLSDEVNARRQAQLLAMLSEQERALIPGEGVDPAGDWPAEASVLILDIERDEALELGRVWDQNAIVYGEGNGSAELLWCVEA